MRTTIDVDDGLLRRARQRALETGHSLSDVVEEALRCALSRGGTHPRALVKLPVIHGAGPAPTRGEIRRLIDDDDVRHFRSHLAQPSVNDGPA